tara:strand:+ start:2189 stop:4636 length:2448 start_codon:yes stop_codon:yes gene_type:complete
MHSEKVLECNDFKTPYHFLGFLPRKLSVAATKAPAAPYDYSIAVFIKRIVDTTISSVDLWIDSCKETIMARDNVACFLVPDMQDSGGTDLEYLLLNHLLTYKSLHYMALRPENESAGNVIKGYLTRAIPWYLGSHMDQISTFAFVKCLDIMPRLAMADVETDQARNEAQLNMIQGFYHYFYYLEWMKFALHAAATLVCLSGNVNEPKNTFLEVPDDDVVNVMARIIGAVQVPCSARDMSRHAFNYWFSRHNSANNELQEIKAVFKIVYPTLNCGKAFSGQSKQFFDKQFAKLARILPTELLEKRCADLIPQPAEGDTVFIPVLDLSDTQTFMCSYVQQHFGIFVTSFKHNDGTHLDSKSELIRSRPEWKYVETVGTLPGGRRHSSLTSDVWKVSLHPFIQRYFFPSNDADDLTTSTPYIVWQWKSGQFNSVNFELPNPQVLPILQAIHDVDGYYPWVSPGTLETYQKCVEQAQEKETASYDYLNMLATDTHGKLLDQSEFTLVSQIAKMCDIAKGYVPDICTSFVHPCLISSNVFDPLDVLAWVKSKSRTSNVDRWIENDSTDSEYKCVYICQPLDITDVSANSEILRGLHDSLTRILELGTERRFKIVFCISPITEHVPAIQVLLHYFQPFNDFSLCLKPNPDLQSSPNGVNLLSSNVSFGNWMRQYEEKQAAQFLAHAISQCVADNPHQLYFRELIDALPFAVNLTKATQKESDEKIVINVCDSVRYSVAKFKSQMDERKKFNKAQPTTVEVKYRFKGSAEFAFPIPKLLRIMCDALNEVPMVHVKLSVHIDSDLPTETSARPCLAEIARRTL